MHETFEFELCKLANKISFQCARTFVHYWEVTKILFHLSNRHRNCVAKDWPV